MYNMDQPPPPPPPPRASHRSFRAIQQHLYRDIEGMVVRGPTPGYPHIDPAPARRGGEGGGGRGGQQQGVGVTNE